MPSADLVVICLVAFLVVFVILAFLALMMRVIMSVFPEKKMESEAAIIAAIAAVTQTVFPGTQITHVEERK